MCCKRENVCMCRCTIYIYTKQTFLFMITVGSQFVAQAQKIWDMSPMSPIQWICRELVDELGINKLNNG